MGQRRAAAVALACLLAFTACARLFRTLSSSIPPSGLAYADNPAHCLRGVPVRNVLTVAGDVSVFAVTPPLPAGLTLDSTTGAVIGTPSELSLSTSYTVTATNTVGSQNVSLVLDVGDTAPTALTYAVLALSATRGIAIADDTPGNAGGLVKSYRIAPQLPPGLGLNEETGVIFGTPLQTSATATYSVTATNDYGMSAVDLTITVIDEKPILTFAARPFRFVNHRAASSGIPAVAGGVITHCDWKEGTPLPPALTVDATTCAISGVPTAAVPPTTYTLAVDYFGGSEDVGVDIVIADALAIWPPSVTLPTTSDQPFTFTATGGVPPYVFDLLSGLGEVTTIDPSNGIGTYSSNGFGGRGVVRLIDAAGTVATASVHAVLTRVDGQVSALVTDASGSLFAGGAFTAVNPYRAPGLIALDSLSGAPRLGFDLQQGFDYSVLALAISGSTLYVGGDFTTYRSLPARSLAKLDAITGALDATFTQSIGFAGGQVRALAANASTLFVAGNFTSYRGQPVGPLVYLDPSDGHLLVQAQLPPSASGLALLAAPDGVFVGGSFVGASPGEGGGSGFTKLDLAGQPMQPWKQLVGPLSSAGAPNAVVHGMLLSGSDLYLAGNFQSVHPTTTNEPVSCIAKVDATTGALDATFSNGGFGPTGTCDVNSLATGGGALYAGGTFSSYRGAAVSNLAKLSPALGGALDASFSAGGGPLPMAQGALAADATGVYLATFGPYRGGTLVGLARLAATDGAVDGVFTQARQFDSLVQALLLDGSTLYAAGIFRYYRGFPVQNIAKFAPGSGLGDPSFNANAHMSDVVRALAVDDATHRVFAAGVPGATGPSGTHGVAAFATTDGTPVWVGQGTGLDAQAFALAFDSVANLLTVGGSFTHYNGALSGHLVVLNAANGSPTLHVTPGFNNDVYALGVNGAHSVIVGGAFSSYGATGPTGPANALAKISTSDGTVDGTFTQSPGLALGPAASPLVSAMLLDPLGNVYVGGSFDKYRGVAVGPNFAQLLANTGAPGAIKTALVGADVDPVLAIAYVATPQTAIVVGGSFQWFNLGQPNQAAVPGLAPVSPFAAAGQLVWATSAYPSGAVYCVLPIGGRLLVGRALTSFGDDLGHLVDLDLLTGAPLD